MERNGRFAQERYQEILSYLEEHHRAEVEELAKSLFVSPATIRRDLSEMQRLGMLQRTHGGAVPLSDAADPSLTFRMGKDVASKEAVAALALERLGSFSSVFIDNSSTSLSLALRMNLAHKTVVTNGLQVAAKLAEKKDVQVIFLGGAIRGEALASSGSYPCKMLHDFSLDLFLSGAAGIDLDGVYERSFETMEIKQAAMERCKRKILLVGKSKFGRSFPYRVALPSAYELIITDIEEDRALSYKNAGLPIINQ